MKAAFTPNGSVNATAGINGFYTHETVFKTVFVILSILIVLSNATVLLLYHITSRIRSIKNLLLASLALSDLSAGTVVIPITQSCLSGEDNWNICISSAILFRFLAFSTMLHIVAIIFEMYISILHPFWFVQKIHVRAVSACIWSTSFIVSILPLAWLQDARYIVDPVSARKELIYFLVTFVVFFIIPFFVIVFAQVRMLRAISRSFTLVGESVPTPPQTPMESEIRLTSLQSPAIAQNQEGSIKELGPAPRRAFSSRQNRKVLIAFAFMLGTFTLCWLTWYLGILFSYVDKDNKFLTAFSPDVKQTFHVLLFLPPLVNPLLYTYYKQDFRQALQALLKTSLKTLCH